MEAIGSPMPPRRPQRAPEWPGKALGGSKEPDARERGDEVKGAVGERWEGVRLQGRSLSRRAAPLSCP